VKSVNDQRKVNHLMWRAGFGPGMFNSKYQTSQELISKIFNASKKFEIVTIPGWEMLSVDQVKKLTDAQRKEYNRREKKARSDLQGVWFDKFTETEFTLREKMALFWVGHFAARVTTPTFALNYLNTIRQHALGKFPELLRAMIKDAALLQFLNNNLNRKLNPNENFARELMELFTLGRGNYSETDVKEAARAFTGWGFTREGAFLIRDQAHDTGTKIFLGETGNFDGNDVANIIVKKKECAVFITRKIYTFFVNDIPDETIIRKLAHDFYDSGYDIEKLMRAIFSSNWFYDEKNIGIKIKSPIELMGGMIRDFKIRFKNPVVQFQVMKILGQVIFYPPSVAGWPGGKNWIDSSTIMYRMRIAWVILKNAELLLQPKDEFDALQMSGADIPKGKTKILASFDVNPFLKKFAAIPESQLTSAIPGFMLQVNPPDPVLKKLIKPVPGTDRGRTTIKIALDVMSLPEYQLC
jgi:uncharacterized protein (DUF1800 family)